MFERDNKALLDATASRVIRTTLEELQTRNINRSTREKAVLSFRGWPATSPSKAPSR